MESLGSYKEPAELKTSFSDQDIVDLIYHDLSNKINERLTSTPKTFYDAIVCLQCIAKLLEKSQITSEVFGKNFIITPHECQITTDEMYSIPHDILHPVFDSWCQKAHTKIFIEHPKSMAATTIILNALSNNVTLENLEKYQSALATLPLEAKKYIEEKFIEKYGWEIKDLDIELDNNGNIADIQFTIDNFFVKRSPSLGMPPSVAILDMSTLECLYCIRLPNLDLSRGVYYALGSFFGIRLSQSEDRDSLQDFLATKPTFEQVLLNHAKNHKGTLLTRIK